MGEVEVEAGAAGVGAGAVAGAVADPAGGGAPSPVAVVEIAGSEVPAGLAVEAGDRPHVVLVADSWGAGWGERAAAARLVAGALALRARVSIVSLDDPAVAAVTPPDGQGSSAGDGRGSEEHPGDGRLPPLRYDGVFPVHSTVAPPANPNQALILRTALERQPGGVMPELAARRILALQSRPSSDTVLTIVGLHPDVVVLTGVSTLWLNEALPVGSARPRIVVLPLVGNDPTIAAGVYRPILQTADSIGTFSESETTFVRDALDPLGHDRVHRLELALPVNLAAAASGLAGMASFGEYVLFISGFPPDDPAAGRCPPHEYLSHMLGGVAVAEIRHGRWLVSEPGRHHEVVFSPNRMNAWRLMAHAIATVDLRPPGPVGRETIESLLFGTPVVVPDDSAAAEVSAASGGGLWYRTPGEMIDAVQAIVADPSLRSSLGSAGRLWAEEHHGDTERFVEEAQAFVLGKG